MKRAEAAGVSVLPEPSVVFGAPRGEASVPRPLKTYIPCGEISRAIRVESPYENIRSRKTGAQRAGLSYQKKVGRFLSAHADPGTVVDGPWFAFNDDSLPLHYCQPDFLLLSISEVVVVEVKIRWTSDAWWQLRKLYAPVVQKHYPSRTVSVLTISRGYDPAIRCPEEVSIIDALSDVDSHAFNLLVVK